jgi:hypothetical protein
MGPFDLPPSTPPVSFDPPPPGSSGRRSPGRRVAIVAASAALVAAGVLAVGQFASGGRPEVANAARAGDSGSTPPTPAPDTAAPAPVTTPAATSPADDAAPEAGDLDGQITIQIGDGDPIVIDLGDLGALAGEGGGLGDLGNIEQCVGDLSFDIDLDAAPGGLGLPGFDIFGDGDTMTITGPDGLSVLTFGDGDGSVTITKKDGEISISSDGDVQVDDLATAGESLPLPSLPSLSELPDFDHIYECLEDAIGNG